jgi:hypothetical protein
MTAPMGTVIAVGLLPLFSMAGVSRFTRKNCPVCIGSSHASASGLHHRLVDGIQNLVSPEEWLRDERETVWNFFKGAGDQDHGQGGEQIFGRLGQIDSVDVPWHLNVGDQQINFVANLMQDAESLDGAPGFETLNPFMPQEGTEVSANCGLIINDQAEGLIHGTFPLISDINISF